MRASSRRLVLAVCLAACGVVCQLSACGLTNLQAREFVDQALINFIVGSATSVFSQVLSDAVGLGGAAI